MLSRWNYRLFKTYQELFKKILTRNSPYAAKPRILFSLWIHQYLMAKIRFSIIKMYGFKSLLVYVKQALPVFHQDSLKIELKSIYRKVLKIVLLSSDKKSLSLIFLNLSFIASIYLKIVIALLALKLLKVLIWIVKQFI